MDNIFVQSLDQDIYTVKYTIEQLKDLIIFLNGIEDVEFQHMIENLGNDSNDAIIKSNIIKIKKD